MEVIGLEPESLYLQVFVLTTDPPRSYLSKVKAVVGQLRRHKVLGDLDAVVEVSDLVASPGGNEDSIT